MPDYRKRYRVVGAFDTETTNIKTGEGYRAFPVLFIYLDVEHVDIDSCDIDGLRDHVRYFRTADTFVSHVVKICARPRTYVPVICAYNLMFDLQSIIYPLAQRYDMRVTAQSSTNVYTLDICNGDDVLLRFWDVFHLETNGLATMGDVAGVPKLYGSWNYKLIRTPETPLSDDELSYAANDVIIIIRYLAYLRTIHDFIDDGDFGLRIITRSSIVRRLAKCVIGKVRVPTKHGKRQIGWLYTKLCDQEKPADFESYALRKACFRGGLSFTSARYASVIMSGVHSLDVTSMHHAHINGMRLPTHFMKADAADLQRICEYIVNLPLYKVLQRFEQPFWFGVHVRVRFNGIRLKSGSIFERDGIAIIPRAKMCRKPAYEYTAHEGQIAQDERLRMKGWIDSAVNPVYAFGKLYRADSCILHLTEYELWNISQVYEWESMSAICGEATGSSNIPPDYVTLQSQYLYRLKTDVKNALKNGGSYNGISGLELENYYNGSVKAMYNSIYGTQAMDEYRPDFKVDDGNILVDSKTIISGETFEDRTPSESKVLYTYGMRIVGRSRMHLVISMMLLGKAGLILGGDTDSIKLQTDKGKAEIMRSLEPLHDAVTRAICNVTTRSRVLRYGSNMDGLGLFEIENDEPYTFHMELWPKARLSYDGVFHVTCAGLPRVIGMENIDDILERHAISNGIESAFELLGYDTNISPDICHSLQHYRPNPGDTVDMMLRDHTNMESHVKANQCIALYPAWKMFGDTTKAANMENVDFVKQEYDRDICTGYHELSMNGVSYGLL